MKNEEREIHAFIFFIDIRGWGGFLRRASHYPTEVLPMWKKWQELINKIEKKKGWVVKRLGDGILVIVEVNPADAWYIGVILLNEIWVVMNECKAMIQKKISPRPDGVRVAGIYGVIWKGEKDWFGDKINVCERMTRQWRGKCCLFNETWKEQISKVNCRRNGFRFSYAGKDPDVQVEPIYEGDMRGNWFFRKVKR